MSQLDSTTWIAGEPEAAGEYLAVVTGCAGSAPCLSPAPYRAIRDYNPKRARGFRWSLGGSYYQVSHYMLLPELPAL